MTSDDLPVDLPPRKSTIGLEKISASLEIGGKYCYLSKTSWIFIFFLLRDEPSGDLPVLVDRLQRLHRLLVDFLHVAEDGENEVLLLVVLWFFGLEVGYFESLEF